MVQLQHGDYEHTPEDVSYPAGTVETWVVSGTLSLPAVPQNQELTQWPEPSKS
mgnify:CR=1 FL=1